MPPKQLTPYIRQGTSVDEQQEKRKWWRHRPTSRPTHPPTHPSSLDQLRSRNRRRVQLSPSASLNPETSDGESDQTFAHYVVPCFHHRSKLPLKREIGAQKTSNVDGTISESLPFAGFRRVRDPRVRRPLESAPQKRARQSAGVNKVQLNLTCRRRGGDSIQAYWRVPTLGNTSLVTTATSSRYSRTSYIAR